MRTQRVLTAPFRPHSHLNLLARGLQWARGRDRMLTFRIAITVAVMAFVTALAAYLILIQIATFHCCSESRGVCRHGRRQR